MTPQEEQKFRKVKIAVDRRKVRLRDELRRRFRSPEALFRQLGMDHMLDASHSVLDDEGARKMAEHGHADLDDDDDDMTWDSWEQKAREMMSKHGMSEDDVSELFSMLPERQATIGEKVQRTTKDSVETEENLESAKNERGSATNYNRRDEGEADRREMKGMAEQSEDRRRYARDRFPKNHIDGNGRGGRFATDHGLAGLDELIGRVGTSMSGYGGRERSTGPNNIALDSVEQNAKFLERLARLEASR